MEIPGSFIEQLIFKQVQNCVRFTQDSPVYPDVWMEYFRHVENLDQFRADLILVPHRNSSAAELFKLLSEGLIKNNKNSVDKNWEMASSGESVVALLTFTELIKVALPLTYWWQHYMWDKKNKPTGDQQWLRELTGALLYANQIKNSNSKNETTSKMPKTFNSYFDKNFKILPKENRKDPTPLWSVSRNRTASVSIEDSVPATKADAGRRVFNIDGAEIAWAVLDTGIDARHFAFRKKDPTTGKPFPKAMGSVQDKFSNHTRVVATYDFTRFRDILATIHGSKPTETANNKKYSLSFKTSNNDDQALPAVEVNNFISEIEADLKSGRFLDWTVIGPLLRIPHNNTQYVPPVHPHGTHIAGIIGAGMEDKINGNLIGMCPGIDLYDIRVMNDDGQGQEFNILAAIQFIRWMNNQKDGLIIHGVNLSFSMIHEVASFACGQTPVCVSCERLIADGTVVVAAAGNLGQAVFQSTTGTMEQGFRMVNITDPGNAESVITVGATHRNRPHTYGVSYFSSKGPTGDGRIKPDLVAPGEKIVSASIDNTRLRMDGTSMAAPHVSGAAALMLARNRELIGRPRRVKEILCKTATDLGREKYFQGCGMIDVLRAIQSI